MEFTQETYNQLKEDIKTVLRTLREESATNRIIKNCPVANINALFQHTYCLYNSYAHNLEQEAIEIYKWQYAKAVDYLRMFEKYGLNEGPEELRNDKAWHFFFSFTEPDADKFNAITSSLAVRIYINPKIKLFGNAMLEIIKSYYGIAKTKRGQMYIKFPKVADQITIDRADKVVIYISEGDVVRFMEVRLKELAQKGYFSKETPRFTSKIADGLAISRTPTAETLAKIPKLWLKMFGGEFDSTSFGHYMTMAILGALQTNLTGYNLRAMDDPLALDEIPKQQYEALIEDIAKNFVAPKAVKIITGQGIDRLGIAA